MSDSEAPPDRALGDRDSPVAKPLLEETDTSEGVGLGDNWSSGPNSSVRQEEALVAALRRGEGAAFETLFELHHTALVRLARVWIRDTSVAEEVAQETWLAVFQGIHAFQARSPLQTWIFSILANKAKRRGTRESRSLPFAAYNLTSHFETNAAMDPEYFYPVGHPGAGHWTFPLADVEISPESHVLAEEAGQFIIEKIDELPSSYRVVILLRDLHGLSADETCSMLGLSANNQRVILHRARTKLRLALEPFMRGDEYAR